jgi:hypothetical protein
VLDNTSVLVKPDVAARQMTEDVKTAGEEGVPTVQPGKAATAAPGVDQDTAPAPGLPKRFYGRASLEPVRMLRDLGDIAEAIVAQLDRAGANVTISVEIEATTDDGFSDDVRRTVSENARTLKFEAHEFED